MTYFEEYLISQGYKRYRKIYEKRKWSYIEDKDRYYFSTMMTGCLDYRYIKGDIEIIFGLHEKDKPPTLEWPRPKGITTDDEMNRILKNKTPKEVYNKIN